MKDVSAVLWTRYGQQLVGLPVTAWLGSIAILALFVASLLPWPHRWKRLRTPARWSCLAILCAMSIAWAWSLGWIADDAFISFRYARNWVNGHGLVFNPGERVEGYTNFLWTALLAAGLLVGIPSGALSVVLGLLSLAATLVLTAQLAERLGSRRSWTVLPVGAALLGSSYLFANYGTSGLETMFACALVVFSVDRALRDQPFASGVAGILATMAHPDHAIFYAALGVALVLDPRRRGQTWRYGIPLLAIYVPYFLTRWIYYGSFFPNTYYAKSANASHFSQGYVYLLVCVLGAGLFYWLPMALVGLRTRRRTLFGRFLLLAAPTYLFYVMKIGGDFMFGRLLVPLLPFAAVCVELGARHLVASKRLAWAAIGVAFAGLSVLPVRILHSGEKLFHLADERTFYPIVQLHPLRVDSPFTTWSDQLLEVFGQDHQPFVATGCVGIVAYRTGYPMLDAFGLTDREIARQPIARRGRPGHEKLATPANLLDRGVMITDQIVYPIEYARFTEVFPGFIPLHLVGYRPALVDALRRSGRDSFPDMGRFLTDYVPPPDPARFDCDLWFFESYYFAHQPPETRRAFVDRLRDRGMLSSHAASLHSLSEDEIPSAWERVGTIGFGDRVEGPWLRTGTAFDHFPSGYWPGQPDAGRRAGPFANSFTLEQGDGAMGAAQSPPFRVEADVITLRVGGGMDMERLRVSLLVEGKEVARATACGSGVLGRRLWHVSDHLGKEARLVILDQQSQGLGHIVVDEAISWKVAP